MNENRAGRVGGIGRQAAVVLFIELDRQRFLGAAGDVVVYGRNELCATKASEYLLPYRLKAWINTPILSLVNINAVPGEIVLAA